MKSQRRLRRVLALVGVGVLLQGCQSLGIYNYSATRDEQGKQLETSYAKWKLKDTFETASAYREKLLAEQIAVVGKLSDVRRDGYVRTLATGRDPREHSVEHQLNWLSDVSGADVVLGSPKITGATLANRLQARQARSKTIDEWLKGYAEVQSTQVSIAQVAAPEFNRVAVDMPSCEDIAKGGKASAAVDAWIVANPLAGAGLASAFSKLKTDCQAVTKGLATIAVLDVGAKLKAVRSRLVEEQLEYAGLKAVTAADRTAVNTAISERNEAVAGAANAKANGDTATETVETNKIRTAAAKLQALLPKIQKAQDAFSIAFISEKEQDSMDEFLATIVNTPEGATPKADSNKAAMALVLFPDLLAAAQKKLDDADAISLAPLVMKKQLAQIAKDAATKEISVRAKRIALLEQQEQLLTEQAASFVDIDFLMAGVPKELLDKYPKQYPSAAKLTPLSPALLGLPMAEVLATRDGQLKDARGATYATTTQEERAAVWRAAITYIDEGTRRNKNVVAIGLTLDLLAHQTRLSYSEANVMQWNALVSAKVEQLALYGKTGIKGEQYAALVNNLMLFWIGLRIPQ